MWIILYDKVNAKGGTRTMRILIVEDDLALQRIIVKRLRETGYIVKACATGTDRLGYASSADFDAIVLDVMLPGIDGLSILRTLRAQNRQVGILLLTARDSIEDRVTGLDAGADDYLVKPFAFEELLARLRTLLRRPNAATPATLQVADLTLNTATHEVSRAGRAVTLTSKEYALGVPDAQRGQRADPRANFRPCVERRLRRRIQRGGCLHSLHSK
jgi:DNA-binding response OmpR family regulator